jgi:SAM-dependent methyltransferase
VPVTSMVENFEEIHRHQAEPWSYSSRAAEALRHEAIAEAARRLAPPGGRILDVGCSLGQLTGRLAGVAAEICGIDISPTAARISARRCAAIQTSSAFSFAAASSMAPPFRARRFDLVLLCDGLHSWRLNPGQQDVTLRQIHHVTRPGGYVILTEYLKTRQFEDFVATVRRSPFQIVETRFLRDRLWYTLERLLRPVRHRMGARRVLASHRVGRALATLAGVAGRHGSKHIMVIARRTED